MKLDEEGYRGKLYFQKSTADKEKFVVINELPLEEYLYSVIPSEMPSSYPMEALKAQAICARTYAVIHMMNPAYPDYDAHVNDTTSFQVYHKIDEQLTTNHAVDETKGMLLYEEKGNELVETYYYSTSCGDTCEASTNIEFEEYITKRVPSDVELNESWYRWTCSVNNINNEDMLEKIQARYKVNPSKILTEGEHDVFKSEKVSELNEIKELFISKRGEGGVGEELIISTGENIYKIIGEYNIRYVLNDKSSLITKQDGSQTTMNNLLPSAFISLKAIKTDGKITGYHIVGGGYGHGMGMSQNGAKGMAELGYCAEEILMYYYPASKIKKIL
jgi:stage II sporulation protein D